ncbi:MULTISPECIES: hypothetical protein [unclassified Actinoplanes]|uniref:hypothetical protein n=1 Tax=unclassified Actinoplanes TaxID=2626549 RepID=UPI0012BA7D2E|nr:MULTISPECIES: hypothetical protein [unclassified Actinoplanes]
MHVSDTHGHPPTRTGHGYTDGGGGRAWSCILNALLAVPIFAPGTPAWAASKLGGRYLHHCCAAIGVGHAKRWGATDHDWFWVDGDRKVAINTTSACWQTYGTGVVDRLSSYPTGGWECWG